MSLEFKAELIHVFPGCGKSTPFQASDDSNIGNISNEYIFETNAHCCSMGKAFIIKIDLEQFHDEVMLTPGSEGQPAFDAKLEFFSQNLSDIEAWALSIVPEEMESINVYIVVNRIASVIPKYLRLVSIVHPENYDEETLNKIDRMNLLDHFTVEQMNEWITKEKVMNIVKFYGVKASIITVIKGNIFLNHTIVDKYDSNIEVNEDISDDSDTSESSININKFIPIEICKSYADDIEVVYTHTFDTKDSNVFKLSSIYRQKNVDGRDIVPLEIRNKLKNQSVTARDVEFIMKNVQYYFSNINVNSINIINKSVHSIFIVFDEINLAVFSDKVIRIGNSKRIASNYDENNIESYRVSYARQAHYITDKYSTFNSTLFDYIIRSTSIRKNISYNLAYTDKHITVSEDDDGDVDPDGRTDIDESQENENDKVDQDFNFKFITCESNKESNQFDNMSDMFINLDDVLSNDDKTNLSFISDDFDRKQATILLIGVYVTSNYDDSSGQMFVLYSVEWWLVYGIKADIAIGLSANGSLEGHPLPIILYSEDQPLIEKTVYDLLHSDIKSVYTLENGNEEESDDSEAAKNTFLNNANNWLTAFESIDAAIIGDKEKLTGLSINCISSYAGVDNKDDEYSISNRVTIARLYKRVTVYMVEDMNMQDVNKSSLVRSNFVDICNRIDNSIVEFSQNFNYKGSNRLRKADDEQVSVDKQYDNAFGYSTSDDTVKKSLTYSVVAKFLPYVQEVLTATKNIHPRFDSRNFSLMEGAESGSIGVGFKFLFFSSLNAVIFYNSINSDSEKGKMGSFFVITNISKELFFRDVINDKNGFLSKEGASSFNMKINTSFNKGSLFDQQDRILNLAENKFDKFLVNGRYAGSNNNTSFYNNSSVPTVNKNEIEHSILGNNTLVLGFTINGESYMIADTRVSSGNFINTDVNVDKIQTYRTISNDVFSIGCAGRVSDIQFTHRIIGDILEHLGESWEFKLFIDTLSDFVYSSDHTERYLNIQMLIMHENTILEIHGDGASLDYSSTKYHCIGSGMLFILPAVNVLFNTGEENVSIEKIVSIFLTASKFDAGISTTYVINKIGEDTIKMLSYEQASVDNFVPHILNSPTKTINNKENK